MATQKRYYWLKLQDGFFTSKRIKKLRKLAGGDTYTIIYLKMQLLAMKSDGILRWTGLENDFASELALDLDEDTENVVITLQYLLSCGLAEKGDNTSFFFPYAVENTGSETSAAKRMREMRERNNVTPQLQKCYGEKDIEKETEKDLDIEKEKGRKRADKPPATPRFSPPSIEEVRSYCLERRNNVDPEQFVDFYTAKGWKVGAQSMKDWKAAVRTWEKRDGRATGQSQTESRKSYAQLAAEMEERGEL